MKEKTISYLEYLELILEIFINGECLNPWLCSANYMAASRTQQKDHALTFYKEMRKQCGGHAYITGALYYRKGSLSNNEHKYFRIFTIQRLIAIERMKLK